MYFNLTLVAAVVTQFFICLELVKQDERIRSLEDKAK